MATPHYVYVQARSHSKQRSIPHLNTYACCTCIRFAESNPPTSKLLTYLPLRRPLRTGTYQTMPVIHCRVYNAGSELRYLFTSLFFFFFHLFFLYPLINYWISVSVFILLYDFRLDRTLLRVRLLTCKFLCYVLGKKR